MTGDICLVYLLLREDYFSFEFFMFFDEFEYTEGTGRNKECYSMAHMVRKVYF
jgi:hypothetical protein